MKKIVLKADSGSEKHFGLAHAQAILLHQDKTKSKDKWSIVGDDYEFNGKELYATKPDKRKVGAKAEQVGSPTSKDTAK